MKNSFRNLHQELRRIAGKFDPDSVHAKEKLLERLSEMKLPLNGSLSSYCDTLMFLSAYPAGNRQLKLAQEELRRLSSFLKKNGAKKKEQLENSGLPYTTSLSTYSHDLLRLLHERTDIRLSIDSFQEPAVSLNEALSFTLPLPEKEITSAGFSNRELFACLLGPQADRIGFLLSEFSRLDTVPFIKDHLFGGLHLYIKVKPLGPGFSKAFNRYEPADTFFHQDLLKHFDQRELLDRKLPAPLSPDPKIRQAIIQTIRDALTLLQRETDPVTYMDPGSFRLYELERGISIAIYGMTADRQLPLESYVGYTLFKNGYPAAYGGAWVLGRRALFGINVFESFRGGESGFILCQLLRVYRQAFGVSYFEVEPYQYGKGNPEGIQSGAFWFYHRFGFRPLDRSLLDLSEKENRKMQKQKGYRSTEETLLRFTEGNIALQLGNSIPPLMSDIRDKITTVIRTQFGGNRPEAETALRKKFAARFGGPGKLNVQENAVFSEMAFVAEALGIRSAAKGELLKKMMREKPADVYRYQQLVTRFFERS